MIVRAKFWCRETVTTTVGTTVKFSAVCRGQDNKAWASATPVANLEMTILNEVAAKQFTPGEEYFLDFTPAPKGRAGMYPDDE